MAKFFKFIIILGALLVVALVGASFALRAYFTDSRIRAMIIPPAEKILGRTVEIGHVKVSLLSGLQVYDFVVKEENGQDNFVSSSQFVLSYELLPLLQKKVVFRDVRLVDPSIRVARDWRGVFNFASLALLDKKEAPSAEQEPGQSTKDQAALPFNVVVKNFSLENGTVQVLDALEEIPATDVIANADIGLEMGKTIADMRYNGNLRFVVDTVYKGLEVHEEGKIDFDQEKLGFTVDLTLDKQSLQLSGSVAQYMDTSHLPPVVVNVSSPEVNIDQLLASLAILSEKDSSQPAKPKPAPIPGKKSGPLVPKDLSAKGEVRIVKALYQQMEMSDFQLNYTLEKGVFTVSDLKGTSMGGEMRGEAVVQLKEVPTYEGKMGMHGLQLSELQNTFFANSPAQTLGALSGAMTFDGRGINPDQIKKNISALGEFSMPGARITGADFTKALASLLDLQELNDLDLQDMAGSFSIKKGVAQIRSSTKNSSFFAEMNGSVGLDGSLNLPVSLSLSPHLSSRVASRLKAARYLEKKGDRIQVYLAVDGMATSPRVNFDRRQVRRQATGTLIDEVLGEDASPEEKAAGEAVKGLLDNLFGK
ncbi:MAG: AsmA family protein [Thermodesulfobacteriota bacterium]